jgi:hypothetical protein
LKNSDNKREKEKAGEALLSRYRRYRKDKQGIEIRRYEGKYGYSDHTDGRPSYHTDEVDWYLTCEHTDERINEHTDTEYPMNFYPEED